MDADVVLTLGSCIKRKQIFSELTQYNNLTGQVVPDRTIS
jgi:hypothetical protein